MNRLFYPLQKEVIEFSTLKSLEELTLSLQKQFERQNWWKVPPIPGEFISPYEFKISITWKFYTNTIGYKTINVYGFITQNEQKKTIVTITIIPRLEYIIFFGIFPIVGIISVIRSYFNFKSIDTSTSIIFIFIAPLIILFSGYYDRMKIKDKFIDLFKLRILEKK